MKTKRMLLLLLAVILVPGGVLLLLPFAARIFGGIASGLRAELVAVSVVAWLVYQSTEQTHSPSNPDTGHLLT